MILFKKKKLLLIPVVLIIGIWFYLFINVNSRFPEHQENVYKLGQTTIYKGLNITVNSVKSCKNNELGDLYKDYKDILNLEAVKSTLKGTSIFLVDITLENKTKNDIEMRRDKIYMSIFEVGNVNNGSDYNLFCILNPEYESKIKKNTTTHMVIPYTFLNQYVKDVVGKDDAKFIFSYYPTKEYYSIKHDEY